MSANSNHTKGNPASKRMSNTNLKSRRARSWAKGEQRKAERRAAQERAHKRNIAADLTPWQLAKADRIEKRELARLTQADVILTA